MKRRWILVVVLSLCLLFAGCRSWMDGSYHSVEPYRQEYIGPSLESAEVNSYDQLCNLLTDLVKEGSQQSVIYLVGFEQDQMNTLMNMAIDNVTQFDPIGAYAVEKIEYEIGNNSGRTAIAVNLSYIHNRAEILRIKKVENMQQVTEVLTQALEDCEAGVVIQVDQYENADFTQQVQDYVDKHPATCMEMPQVTAAVYPHTGKQRVVELSFTYQTSRDALRTMQRYVEPVFRAAYLNVSSEEDELTKFSRMYAFLMERADYTVETSITPSYSLLRHGVGDSKAFATVYAAMCRQAGLECYVISGTREGDPWVWNMICVDGVYSHVDLLTSRNAGKLQMYFQNEMVSYVWDYSAYPEAVRPVVTTPEQTLPTDPTQETTPQTDETEQDNNGI